MTRTNAIIDPAHLDFPLFNGVMSLDIWRDKYRWAEEQNYLDSIPRIVNGLFAADQELPGIEAAKQAIEFMRLGLIMPAGRIMAGSGTTKHVTLLNCFVNGDMQDSMDSITDHWKYMMLTMQQGGGMGTYFGKLRPNNAVLKRTGKGSRASGPIPFMRSWDAGGKTIESAGARRGAQMWTINDTHPDLLAYITCKQIPGELTGGNISILVSDAFMEAVKEDAEWLLYFHVEPVTRDAELAQYDFHDDEGIRQYVYSVHRARELWETITRATYEYSEPGVIFTDRVNELNNLHYLEHIDCTNPCGEQPLPPDNACDLGHVVLPRMVRNPFTDEATFDFGLLRTVVRVLQRMLDNVWDVTNFPLEQQRKECLSKRRTGLGFTGLADTFAMMGYRYGSARSADLAEQITQTICEEAYETSIDLAIEKGAFPLFDADQYLAPNTFAGSRLPSHIQQRIRDHGIRNGVLLTIAPTGTSSIVYGNPSGGLEPFFALTTKRKVLQPDGSRKEYIDGNYAVNLYRRLFSLNDDTFNDKDLPPYFVSVMGGDLKVEDHIFIQARCQRWIDASISKTTNIPTEMSYEDFVRVYDLAYDQGCKGCTTYRPSDVRGSVLEDANATPGVLGKVPAAESDNAVLVERPISLHGTTYKIKWPRRASALYLTINSDPDGKPFEVFLQGKDGSAAEWTTALSLMITGLFRTSRKPMFIAAELQQIQSVNDSAFMFDDRLGRNRNFGSLPAYIGYLIEMHLNKMNPDADASKQAVLENVPEEKPMKVATPVMGATCPSCGGSTLHRMEGCDKCTDCGYSHCS